MTPSATTLAPSATSPLYTATLEHQLNLLTTPYNPRKYHYYLTGDTHRVDLLRDGYVITKHHKREVCPPKLTTKETTA